MGGWNVVSPFECTGLKVSKRQAKLGETVRVTAEIANTFIDGAPVELLMEGKRYDDLISQGAFPGRKPVRPGLPFPATPVEGPWGAEAVIPGPARSR